MLSQKEVRELIKKTESDYAHVLDGELSNVIVNAPRALMQLTVTTRLETLHEILEEKYTYPWKKQHTPSRGQGEVRE